MTYEWSSICESSPESVIGHDISFDRYSLTTPESHLIPHPITLVVPPPIRRLVDSSVEDSYLDTIFELYEDYGKELMKAQISNIKTETMKLVEMMKNNRYIKPRQLTELEILEFLNKLS